MQLIEIQTDAEYEAALDRAEELLGCHEGSEDEQELLGIADAIEVWVDKARPRRVH